MKNLILIFTILFSMVASAGMDCSTSTTSNEVQEKLEIKTDVPKYLEGATITVTLKDGTSTTVPAEKFKVVKRQQQFIVTKVKSSSKEICTANDRNRVSVIAGKGVQGHLKTNRSNAPDEVTVENEVGGVYGLQYQYKTDKKLFNMPLSIGVQGQTNKTGSILLGVDF